MPTVSTPAVPGLDADYTANMDADGQHSLANKLRAVLGLDADRYQLQC
jgi:hypothetical protein